MPLPTWQDLKVLVRAQTSAEDGGPGDTPSGTGNGLLAQIVARATSAVEAYLQRPIVAEPITAVDRAESLRVWGVIDQLLFPASPLSRAEADAPVLVDRDGQVVDPTTYDVDWAGGRFLARAGISFDNGPYTMTAVAGLSADPRYPQLEPLLSQAILDVAVDLYSRREPLIASEAAGGGVSRQYLPDPGLPPRVRQALGPLRRLGWT